jgi:hypothetical protein
MSSLTGPPVKEFKENKEFKERPKNFNHEKNEKIDIKIPEKKDYDMSNKTCFLCKKLGHLSNCCPDKKKLIALIRSGSNEGNQGKAQAE